MDDEFSENLSEDDDLEVEDEWDSPSESEDGGKKKKKGSKQKTTIPAKLIAPTRGRVTRSNAVSIGTNQSR